MATKVAEQGVHPGHLETKEQDSLEAIEAQPVAAAAENVLGEERAPVGSVPVGAPVVSVPRMDIDERSPEVGQLLKRFAEVCGKSLAYLSDPQRIEDNEKPRVELRRVVNADGTEIANIALCFKNGPTRDANLIEFKALCERFSIVSAGSTTLEIGNKGVDKGTVLDFISRTPIANLLPQYVPGPMIDARVDQSIMAMDADGTLWGKPVGGMHPCANNLSNSPTRDEILNYLRAGGVIAVISGNDPQRTIDRFKAGIPPGEMHLLNNVILSGAGGHTLMVANAEGRFQEVEGFREIALGLQQRACPRVDIVYIGDDHKSQGNDVAGFRKVSMEQALCVTDADQAGWAEDIPPHVVVNGGPGAVSDFTHRVLEKRALTGPTVPLFISNAREMRSSTRSMPAATAVQQHVVARLGGAQGVRDIVHRSDVANGSVTYSSTAIDRLITTTTPLLQDDPTPLDHDGILARADRIASALEEDSDRFILSNNMPVKGFEAQMTQTLDRMELHEGSVVRILEPGNNDQLTPMHVAQMVEVIQKYAAGKGIDVTVQVIVMGKGGHATTDLWHQFAEVPGPGQFSGTDEATSLSTTLRAALREKGIEPQYDVARFTSAPGQVQIKLERDSTNTGENMDRAKEAHLKAEGENPKHVFLASSTPSSLRQALTAAAQYSEDRTNLMAPKLYESLTAIPCERSRGGLEAFNEKQIVTEMFASLAERARFFVYGYRSNGRYIPAGPLSARDREDLGELYRVYGALHEMPIEAAKAVPMNQVMDYFMAQFTTMESSIPWVKETGVQLNATQSSMQRAALQHRDAVARERQEPIFRELQTRYRSFKSVDRASWSPDQRKIHQAYMTYLVVFEGNNEVGNMARLDSFAERFNIRELVS